LFDKLGLTPIKATNKKAWADAMESMAMDDDSGSVLASTDKDSLTMLEFEHPIVGMLLRYRRVSKPCDLFQFPNEKGKGGLMSYVWPDGRLHSRYKMTLKTGRMSTSDPCCQNFGKKADAAMAEIFAPDPPPPSVRSFVLPPEGWVMMETDYSTAELHVLGNLSGDKNLLRALHTLGTDMHTMVAIDSFHLHMFDKDGKEWTEEEICDYAKKLGSDTCEEFENFQKSLTYKNEHGVSMTHSQMKNGPRLAAKQTNFSIMYGIGAAALAMKIKSSTGDERPLATLVAEAQTMLDTWKTRSFPVAWNTLENWKSLVESQGYIENAWGMRKWGLVRPGERNPGYEREFANYAIQSLVSGTIQIATERLLTKRKELGLHFRLQNQIHDALMLEVPKEEIEETKKLMHWAMSEIDIPIYNTGKSFRLESDTDIYTRWGEKLKH
jgi:DNA polymerase I-like protein with 3'-5' exonuclease and polymerase domains